MNPHYKRSINQTSKAENKMITEAIKWQRFENITVAGMIDSDERTHWNL